MRLTSVAAVSCLLAHASRLCAQDADLKAASIVERAVVKVAARAEASIACVLVTRTELYQKVGQSPTEAALGRLGDFDPARVARLLHLTKKERQTLVERLDMADDLYVPESFGSGMVIDARGLILTNFHVVRGATKLFVRLPGGKSGYADIHAADARSDLAVLRLLDRSVMPLAALELGGEDLKRGSFVVMLANPFAAGLRDFRPRAGWGMVASLRRRLLDLKKEEDWNRSIHHHGTLLELDARLGPGGSGGAVFNLKGECVGMTTALAGVAGDGGALAVPLDRRFMRIVEVLRQGEEVEYGFLGIGMPDRDKAGPKGVSVVQVFDGSPADVAALRDDDRIVAIDGEPILNSDDLFLSLAGHLAGSKVTIDFVRDGKKARCEATLAKFWSPGLRLYSSLGKRPFVRGLRVDDASLVAQQPPRWTRIPRGVLVSDVEAGSAADRARLKTGDVVAKVAGVVVRTPADFYREIAMHRGDVELTLIDLSTFAPGLKVTLTE